MCRKVMGLAFVAAVMCLGGQAAAQEGGVLLGVLDGKGYSSYWIVHTPGEARVAATLPDLIVPHGPGFWRAGKVEVCESEAGFGGTRQVIYTAPLASAPVVYQRSRCAKTRGDRHCDIIESDVLYLSPQLISQRFEKRQTEACEPR